MASLLLLLCLAYDVFWVFIQPMFSDGTSVMVEVGPPAHTMGPDSCGWPTPMKVVCCFHPANHSLLAEI